MALTAHPTQSAYIIARALYEEACAESSRRTKDLPFVTPSDMDAWDVAAEAAREDLQIERLGTAMREAEDAMLAWSFEVARKVIKAGPRALRTTKLELVSDIETRCRVSLAARTGALDLALRLVA